MKHAPEQWDDHTLDLVIEESASGLAPQELEELLARVDRRDFEHFERAAAALSLAAIGTFESPPADVMQRLQAAARARYDVPAPRVVAPTPRAPGWIAWAGWVAAAAVLIAFLSRGVLEHKRSVAESRDVLIASAGDLIRAPWKATGDPLAKSVNGDVVWSSARQEGYMRFRDLPANDPRQLQYQLWIFDATRAEWEAKPVDGGVFDVGVDGEVIVPIRAKLDVRDAKLFGVTVEAPGGVVVSKREHLVATASP